MYNENSKDDSYVETVIKNIIKKNMKKNIRDLAFRLSNSKIKKK